MRTSRRHTIALMTAGALVTGLAACGSSDGAEEGEELDLSGQMVGAMEDYGVGDTFTATAPVDFSLLYRDHPNYAYSEEWLLWDALEERTNVTLDATLAPLSDWEQRRSLLVGAGDAPCIIPITYPGQEVPFVASGAILPVSDYVDLMPHYQAKVEEWGLESELNTLRQADGKYYLLPGLREVVAPDYTIGLRTDVLEETGGNQQPETWDDLRTMLADMKEANPEAYPISDRWQGLALLNLADASFGTVGGWGYGEGLVWDEEAGEFQYAAASDGYRDMLEYLNSLVEQGLMDPASFTQEDDQAIQKLSTGESLGITTNWQEILRHRATMEETLGADNFAISKIRIPAGPAGDVIDAPRIESGIMISAQCAENDDFVAMMQFIDWLYYSDEGLEFAKWGVPGETYEVAEDGTRTLAADVNYADLNPGGTQQLQADFGFANGVFMLAHGSTEELTQSTLPEEEVIWQQSMADKEIAEPLPPHPFDELELEQVSLYRTGLQDYVDQMTLQFILGQRDFAEWDAFVEELEGRNMTAYVDLANQARERFVEENPDFAETD
ncbi:extracellular solute-binding protein [Modestobacter sp. VKM Ac-2977]|uniref:ABC transporter substrate-binding protein n=1 Tax=Modestobacter sp. VKM Ac-2977 TaxID=3004131 RepID=UPI0022AA6097|nr:extracellular solute-binding protein [Modestobacter sp. VKM Ac-2977]MCZ2822688.1 extracellular solute-binding protein [Modestobacter sp. VKM Ac-2977]